MKLTWLGHACFLLESEKSALVFDPYAPNYVPGFSLPELKAELCICSHGHDDHSYAPAVSLTGKTHDFEITQIPCFHDEKQGNLRGENLITIAEAEGLRVAHMGDLGHDLSVEQLGAMGRIDVLMIPIGGYYTIDSKTAASIAKRLKPRYVIPMHYRGEGFGYDVLETVDGFLSLMDNVKYSASNSIIIDKDAEASVVVLPAPLIKGDL